MQSEPQSRDEASQENSVYLPRKPIVHLQQAFCPLGRNLRRPVVAAAMIDRLVHHAEVINLKGDSYRLKDRDLGRVPDDDAA